MRGEESESANRFPWEIYWHRQEGRCAGVHSLCVDQRCCWAINQDVLGSENNPERIILA